MLELLGQHEIFEAGDRDIPDAHSLFFNLPRTTNVAVAHALVVSGAEALSEMRFGAAGYGTSRRPFRRLYAMLLLNASAFQFSDFSNELFHRDAKPLCFGFENAFLVVTDIKMVLDGHFYFITASRY